jgi:uncharacterized protein YdhG (YjbR/CyaY superfamily)
MKYEANTPTAYLENLEDDWRKPKLLEIRELISRIGPDLKEHINYNMLAYGDGAEPLFHLNAQKNYVSLYVGDITKVDENKELLAGFNMGKGCIRVKKTNNIAESGMEEFIKKAVAIWRDGGDTSC